MPSYHWMLNKKTDFKSLPGKIAALRKLGVPYEAMDKHEIEQGAREQARQIAKNLVAAEVTLPDDLQDMDDEAEIAAALSERQIISMIAYLQKLGAYDEVKKDDIKDVPNIIDPDKKHSSASN
jgi:cytochrome c oxidase cbb3-type subunit I/II